ncbi:pentapeptide repeat-containing protein [Maridesulfovibrio frigidus]|uniref:pentapeptide repeat-containing protein n=1 Tax=Maridesulfovibrio frigidus TaxID=340956 RepID=UPI0004E0C0D3|nr:pentapeptide repeat-containing protein [Maridesulfovibrio frigidus]
MKDPIKKLFAFELKVDFKKLLFATIKSALSASFGNHENMTYAGIEMLDSISLLKQNKSWKDEANYLVVRSLLQTIGDIVNKNNDLPSNPIQGGEKNIEKILLEFYETQFNIKPDFVENPDLINIIVPAQKLLHGILEEMGIASLDAKNIIENLPFQFVYNIRNEWVKNGEKYKFLRESLACPFNDLIRKEEQWKSYLARLQLLFTERVFDSSFGLNTIYIPLRGSYLVDSDDSLKQACDILKKVENWLKQKDNLLFIKGGPGCGKSSFAKKLCSKLATYGEKVIFIQLQKFNIDINFARAVDDYLYEHSGFDRDSGALKEATLLVLDGLDEISESGPLGYKAAENFMGYLTRSQSNYQKFKTIITGRNLAVETVEMWGSGKIGVITVLGYLVNPDEQRTYSEESEKIISTDQRLMWWNRYCKVKGIEDTRLPSFFKMNSLQEISAQPLLNYLLALAVENGIVVSRDTNINTIYKHLLEQVFNKKFSISKYPGRGVKKEDFNKLLKEIALCAWQGGEVRVTTWEKIKSRCSTESQFAPLMKSIEQRGDNPYAKLLVSFYFGSAGKDYSGNRAFEFTHKSFGEYLAARRIVEEVERLYHAGDLYSNEDFFRKWVRIFGYAPIEMDFLQFIQWEIGQHDKKTIISWQQMLIEKINSLLKNNYSKSIFQDCRTFKEMCMYARNAEESLFVILNICAVCTETISNIKWPTRTSFSELIHRIQRPKGEVKVETLLNCLSYLNISGQMFHRLDLYKANLAWSCLNKVIAYKCIFSGADLKHTTFLEADLKNSYFEKTDLQYANLRKACLIEAKLEGADLAWSNLEKTDLRKTDCSWVRAQKAILTDANLEEANLYGANFQGATLHRVHLSKARMGKVKFERASFRGTDLNNCKEPQKYSKEDLTKN